MTTRNKVALGLTIVSMALIIPGLRSDALTITATMPLLKKPLYEETQSILRAIQRLYDSKNYFVAGLVLLFSVIVPFIKAGLLAVILTVEESGDEVPPVSVRAIGEQVGDGGRVCRRHLHRVHGRQCHRQPRREAASRLLLLHRLLPGLESVVPVPARAAPQEITNNHNE